MALYWNSTGIHAPFADPITAPLQHRRYHLQASVLERIPAATASQYIFPDAEHCGITE